MNRKYKLFATLFAAVFVFAIALIIVSAASNAETDRFLEEVDLFLAEYETKREPEPSFRFQEHMMAMAAESQLKPQYTWNQEMIGKVVAYEVGWCCKQCQLYVASACLNRFYDWYDRDVIAMITDNNGTFYMMNPEYVTADEMNGFNFWENYDSIMPVVARATNLPMDVYYWDNEDTQGDWAELVWHCKKDNCYFYR